MKQHFCIHGAYILIVLLVSKPFAVAVTPTVYNFQVGSSKQEMFLAQDEVYLEIENGVTVQKWEALLSPIIESAKILSQGSQAALVKMTAPADYSDWFKEKSSQLASGSSKLTMHPVLYNTAGGSFSIETSSNKNTFTPRVIPKEFTRTAENLLIATSDIILEETNREKVALIANETNAQGFREVGDGNHYYLTYKNGFDALGQADKLSKQGYTVTPDFGYRVKRMATVNDPLYRFQWHLKNTGETSQGEKLTKGIDINVEPAWDITKGSGSTIAIIDDGVQITHEDLVANTGSITHLNIPFGGNNPAPTSPTLFSNNTDSHGTACAGLAAARGDNRIGVSGVAPLANLVGIKLFYSVLDNNYLSTITSAQEARAFSWQNDKVGVYSNSWGKDFSTLGSATSETLKNGFTSGRNGLGNVYVFSAGNGSLFTTANSNGYASSPYVITVGAIGADGKYASYTQAGACVLLSAPGGDNIDSSAGIYTTDITGSSGFNNALKNSNYTETSSNLNYTSTFGGSSAGRYFGDSTYIEGTSAAAPIVAGVVGLMQSVAPTLNARDIRDILVQTASRVDASDKLYEKNGAGFYFHPYYGFGMVNASAAVSKAKDYKSLGNLSSFSTPLTTVNLTVGKSATTASISSASYKFDLSNYLNYRIEHVVLTYDGTFSISGATNTDNIIETSILSPSGTRSYLNATGATSTPGDDFYPANLQRSGSTSTVQFWGERSLGLKSNPHGQWRVVFKNPYANVTAKITKLQLTIFGTEIKEPRGGYGIQIPDKDPRVNNSPGNTTIGLPKKPASGTTNKSLQLPGSTSNTSNSNVVVPPVN